MGAMRVRSCVVRVTKSCTDPLSSVWGAGIAAEAIYPPHLPPWLASSNFVRSSGCQYVFLFLSSYPFIWTSCVTLNIYPIHQALYNTNKTLYCVYIRDLGLARNLISSWSHLLLMKWLWTMGEANHRSSSTLEYQPVKPAWWRSFKMSKFWWKQPLIFESIEMLFETERFLFYICMKKIKSWVWFAEYLLTPSLLQHYAFFSI